MAQPKTVVPGRTAADGPVCGCFYWLTILIFRMVFSLYGCRVTGLEHVPAKGPVIIAPNHASYWDPMLVGSVVALQTRRRILKTMGKAELFAGNSAKGRALAWCVRHMGTFPVNRAQLDRSTLRNVNDTLRFGGALLMFAEGTRTPDGNLGMPSEGLAVFAQQYGATVVPTLLDGTQNSMSKLRPGFRLVRTGIHFCEPILTAPFLKDGKLDDQGRAAFLKAWEDSIREAAADLGIPFPLVVSN